LLPQRPEFLDLEAGHFLAYPDSWEQDCSESDEGDTTQSLPSDYERPEYEEPEVWVMEDDTILLLGDGRRFGPIK
jgi:hypothetical protein